MKDIGMKIAIILGVAAAVLTSIPLLAQEAGAGAQENSSANAAGAAAGAQAGASSEVGANARSAGMQADESGSALEKTTYEATAGGFGDQSASHAWEMSSITGELATRLDSKTAKPGEPVVLKTIEKVQTSDGTIIPRGSRLIGHVTQVQAYSKEHGAALLGVAFDRVEMKGGRSVAIYTLIRGATAGPSAMAMDRPMGGGGMDAPMGGGMMGGGAGMGNGRGGVGAMGGAGGIGSAGGTIQGAGSMAGDAAGAGVGAVGGVTDRTGGTASSIDDQAVANLGATENAGVDRAGHGDQNVPTGAHAAAAARAVPHPTGIPRVMLAGNSSASGLFIFAGRGDIQLESGTQMQLGIVAK